MIRKNLCAIPGCTQCLSGDRKCDVCYPGFVLNRQKSECIDCGTDTSPKAENLCHGFTKKFTATQVERTGLGIAKTSGFESEIDLSKSGSVFKIDIEDFEKWNWRFEGDGSKYSELDGGLMRHNIFKAFRFDISGVQGKYYNSSFAVFNNEIFLAFNFSVEFNDKVLRLSLRDTVLGERHLGAVGLDNNIDEHGEEIRRTSELILFN